MSKKKILIIEDEPAIADNIIYALQTEGYHTAHCSTFAEGLEIFSSGGIDIIILDVGLPDRNGFELCKEIRRHSNIPVIFLSARDSEIDRVLGLELGGDDYVVKPFSPRELSARVNAVLRRTSQSNEAKQNCIKNETPFVVDANKYSILYYGRHLELSRYEFKILELLVKKPGWVFSRNKIMEMTRDMPEMSLDRTIDTHIKTIRAKLKKINPDVDPIKTHRGLGYSLNFSDED